MHALLIYRKSYWCPDINFHSPHSTILNTTLFVFFFVAKIHHWNDVELILPRDTKSKKASKENEGIEMNIDPKEDNEELHLQKEWSKLNNNQRFDCLLRRWLRTKKRNISRSGECQQYL